MIVPAGADDATVQWHVRRQVKSALGALVHGPRISLRDRDARQNLDQAGFVREPMQVVAPDGSPVRAVTGEVGNRFDPRQGRVEVEYR